jgi:hypothetical protein
MFRTAYHNCLDWLSRLGKSGNQAPVRRPTIWFAVREKATRELEKLDDLAAPACRRALATVTTVEVRRRLERVLEQHSQWSWPPRLRLVECCRG